MTQLSALSKEEVHAGITDLPEWQIKADKLEADFVFKDFKNAFAFMTLVATEAEKMNHHPE